MLISVIVPVYKVEEYLSDCVESILAQTHTDLEIILVDDGSPDRCGVMCDEYAEKDSRIHVIHRENAGVVEARIAGYDASHGEYIFFVDSDDWIEKETLAAMAAAVEKTRASLAVCQLVEEHGHQNRFLPSKPEAGYYDRQRIVELLRKKALYDASTRRAGMSFYFGGKLFRKAGLREVLAYGRGLWYEEDLASILYFLYYADSMMVLPDFFYHYVWHDDQVVQQYSSDSVSNLIRLLERIENLDKEGYLREQIPHRFCMEIYRVLTLCERHSAGSTLFRQAFSEIVNHKRMQELFHEISGVMTSGERKKIFLLKHRLCMIFYWKLKWKHKFFEIESALRSLRHGA